MRGHLNTDVQAGLELGTFRYENDALTARPQLHNDINAFVLSIIINLPISKKRLLEFQTETEKDQDLQNLKQYTLKGWPEKSNVEYPLKPYYPMRDEISYHEKQ